MSEACFHDSSVLGMFWPPEVQAFGFRIPVRDLQDTSGPNCDETLSLNLEPDYTLNLELQ